MPRVLLCVSIDCECDKGPRWRTRFPLGFEGVRRGVAERIHPLCAARGAKPTYLLSPELLRDPASVEVLGRLRGCELGTHLHGEMADPGALLPEITNEVQRDYPAELELAKLTSLTGAFRGAFGRSPATFRAGRFGVGPRTLPILERLGYRVESSVTPGVDWSYVSPGLGFVDAPEQPYHPDPGDPGRPGGSRVLEVPVTIVPRRLARVPLVGRLAGPRWLRPTWARGHALVDVARTAIARARRDHPDRPVVLNAMFHNVEVIAGASPYAATDRAARAILDRLGVLLAWAGREGVACVALADVPGELEAARAGGEAA